MDNELHFNEQEKTEINKTLMKNISQGLFKGSILAYTAYYFRTKYLHYFLFAYAIGISIRKTNYSFFEKKLNKI